VISAVVVDVCRIAATSQCQSYFDIVPLHFLWGFLSFFLSLLRAGIQPTLGSRRGDR